MAKAGPSCPDEHIKAASLEEQPAETQALDLLDEIYELEQFRRDQLVLRKLSGYLKSSLTIREMYAAVQCFGPQLWPFGSGAVYSLHATEDRLERVAVWGDASLSKPSFALQDCWAMRRSQIHYVGRMGRDLACGHIIKAAESQQSICMPLVAQGHVFGLLHLQHFRNRTNPPGDEDSVDPNHDLVTMVGEELSYAFANIRLRESLHEQSLRDPLTGLFNRRFVEEYLHRELARAERKARQLSVIALDIDHFKHFNDTFGHGAGDVVLQHVGVILQAHVRSSDVACRVGGEEFMLLLAESPLQIATRRAEAIRNTLRQTSLTYGESKLGPITASFGAAAYPDHGSTLEAIIRAADEALYNAKRAGRDRVVPAATKPN